MGGPTSSYAAAGIALEFTGAHKLPHPATKCFRQGGDTIQGDMQSTVEAGTEVIFLRCFSCFAKTHFIEKVISLSIPLLE
jgi:hypothetical protein